MKHQRLILALALLVISPLAARAQDCPTLVGEYTSWLTNREAVPANTRKVVGFTISTNQRNDQADGLSLPSRNNLDATLKSLNTAAFGVGTLRALPGGATTLLDGIGQLYFSDRSRDPGSAVYTGFTGRTDRIRLRVAPNGAVVLTLMEWGDAAVPISARCENGVMLGFGASVGNQSRPAMYVFSFYKQFIPQ